MLEDAKKRKLIYYFVNKTVVLFTVYLSMIPILMF